MPRLSDNLTPSQLINNHPLARRKIATTFTSWWFLNMLRLCLRCRRCERKKLSLSRGTRSTHTYLSKYSDRNNYLDIHRNILHNRITPILSQEGTSQLLSQATTFSWLNPFRFTTDHSLLNLTTPNPSSQSPSSTQISAPPCVTAASPWCAVWRQGTTNIYKSSPYFG